ncbi:MAG: septation regulator SpoVG [Clostridia bacterium]
MNISDVRIRIIRKAEGRLKAVASIVIDNCFVIHDIKIIEGNDDYFIAMPSRKTPDGEFKDVAHPIDSESRKIVCDTILEAFKVELAKPEEEA